jgi:hypothetical protein
MCEGRSNLKKKAQKKKARERRDEGKRKRKGKKLEINRVVPRPPRKPQLLSGNHPRTREIPSNPRSKPVSFSGKRQGKRRNTSTLSCFLSNTCFASFGKSGRGGSARFSRSDLAHKSSITAFLYQSSLSASQTSRSCRRRISKNSRSWKIKVEMEKEKQAVGTGYFSR